MLIGPIYTAATLNSKRGYAGPPRKPDLIFLLVVASIMIVSFLVAMGFVACELTKHTKKTETVPAQKSK